MINIINNLKIKLNEIIGQEFCVPFKGKGSVGMLLENKLGIESNELPISDINGIELKTSNIESKYPISLFNCNFDGPDFFETKKFVERFGVYDKNFNNIKVLFISLNSKEYTPWGKKLKMKLYVDYSERKIYILVANVNGKIIEKRAYWDFKTLEEIVTRKINYVCFVFYTTSFVCGTKFCCYENYYFYRLKSNDSFFKLLNEGQISINIKFGVFKNGKRAGQSYNHGVAFQIEKNALPLLFDQFSQKK